MTTLLADIIARKDAKSKAHMDKIARQKELEELLAQVVDHHAEEIKQIFTSINYYGNTVQLCKGGYQYGIAFDTIKNCMNVGFDANTASCGYDGVKISYELSWPNSKFVAIFKECIRAAAARAYRGKHYN